MVSTYAGTPQQLVMRREQIGGRIAKDGWRAIAQLPYRKDGKRWRAIKVLRGIGPALTMERATALFPDGDCGFTAAESLPSGDILMLFCEGDDPDAVANAAV